MLRDLSDSQCVLIYWPNRADFTLSVSLLFHNYGAWTSLWTECVLRSNTVNPRLIYMHLLFSVASLALINKFSHPINGTLNRLVRTRTSPVASSLAAFCCLPSAIPKIVKLTIHCVTLYHNRLKAICNLSKSLCFLHFRHGLHYSSTKVGIY